MATKPETLFLSPTTDFSQSKPKLHNLYVRSAYEILSVMDRARKELFEFSNIHASEGVIAINAVIDRLVHEEAAYRDAAAMLFAGIEPPIEQEAQHNE